MSEQQTITETDYLPRKEAAKRLGELVRRRPYNERTLIDWERDGKGPPPTRVGRDVTYRWGAVLAWLKAREQQQKSKAA